ncbi:hypothetical protein BU24DRAFT_388031 [Aaosphaeria arxii CBS 175.79]|uniref:Uncharacterized protein n=1 Tax=Aaosphaeria arxii CBS 175.79 TaxID=1450172 RepID=A0A6A5XVV4_9PLEO|nr:uncharacterized protein BU24DRAFT_388031 [Aaosphaeria arxii CBS 175.79]KAF2017076.1 hypothetical protein BU24DRAFT_388031 [Aaosphaeria arxii CBS 175.79]
MAYYDRDTRHNYSSSRPDHYDPRSYAQDGYPSSPNLSGYTSSYERRYAAQPPLPKRSSAQNSSYSSSPPSSYPSAYRTTRRRADPKSWPPAPTVEDEVAALAKEYSSHTISDTQHVDDEEAKARGSVDQYPIIEEVEQVEQPSVTNDDRRFVLVSDPSDSEDAQTRRKPKSHPKSATSERRKSFAERGNMPYIKTNISDPPVYTERTSTPYASTKPQRESIRPSADEYFLSPESIAPTNTSIPRSVPSTTIVDPPRDQNAKPPRVSPVHSRYDSFNQSPRAPRNDVFEDSDVDEDPALLRTERKPARYSFVKSDLQKEDLRTDLMNSQSDIGRKRPDPPRPDPPRSDSLRDRYHSNSGSPKNQSSNSESPRSSNSSFNGYAPQPKPARVERSPPRHVRTYSNSRPSRPESPIRPSSPLSREAPPSPPRSPKLPPRRPAESNLPSRPSSRSGAPRPPSPLSSSTLPPHVPITEADWHATYPPVSSTDRSRPPSRFSRHETMPVPMPRIDVQSPSPSRPPQHSSALPYPVDDRQIDAFMPPEEAFQYDHSNPTSSPYSTTNMNASYPDSPRMPTSPYPDSPKLSSSPTAGSPRERPSSTFQRPLAPSRHTAPEDLGRSARGRPSSVRGQESNDSHRSERRTKSVDGRLPSCSRRLPSKHDDWYTLEGCPNFDICPDCYNGVFADTRFSSYFRPVRRYNARFCDFSSPWMRLAWLLTTKQGRKEPDLLYSLSAIADMNPPCPNDRELAGVEWYGIADPRDGLHVRNFRVCPCDLKMTEALFPSIYGYMTRLPRASQYGSTRPTLCSLRVDSERFPKYLDLLVEIDEEARRKSRDPDIQRFIAMARDNAFREECPRDQAIANKPWHYIPSLPEFTVCEECYSEVVWPAIQERSPIAKLFSRNTQLVKGEEPSGSSCCLYSPRMRRIFSRASDDNDFNYLKRKAMERKRVESRVGREKSEINRWLDTMNATGGYREAEFERLRRQLRVADEEWKTYE